MDEKQLCSATISVDCCTDFECELAPGHAGDHQCTYTWENEPYGPKLAPREPSSNSFLPTAWADRVLASLANAAALGSPFVNADGVAREIVNRDLL